MRSLCYENSYWTITKISHLDSLWRRDLGELGNGLLQTKFEWKPIEGNKKLWSNSWYHCWAHRQSFVCVRLHADEVCMENDLRAAIWFLHNENWRLVGLVSFQERQIFFSFVYSNECQSQFDLQRLYSSQWSSNSVKLKGTKRSIHASDKNLEWTNTSKEKKIMATKPYLHQRERHRPAYISPK